MRNLITKINPSKTSGNKTTFTGTWSSD